METLRILEALKDKLGQDRRVRDFVLSHVLGDLFNNDQGGQVMRVLIYVKDNLRYVRDPVGLEAVTSPLQLIQTIRQKGFAYGDCEDHALLFNTMLTTLGIQTRFVGVKLGKSQTYNHVISSVNLAMGWRDLDPCVKNNVQPVYRERLVI